MHAIELAAAATAASHGDAALVSPLESLRSTREAIAVNDSGRLGALDIDFHNLVADASQNRAIQLVRQP